MMEIFKFKKNEENNINIKDLNASFGKDSFGQDYCHAMCVINGHKVTFYFDAASLALIGVEIDYEAIDKTDAEKVYQKYKVIIDAEIEKKRVKALEADIEHEEYLYEEEQKEQKNNTRIAANNERRRVAELENEIKDIEDSYNPRVEKKRVAGLENEIKNIEEKYKKTQKAVDEILK